MKVETAELKQRKLNWVVSKITNPEWSEEDRWHKTFGAAGDDAYAPTENWVQGGPIIAQHVARLEDLGDEGWEACAYGFVQLGDTPLEAAMRAYVAIEFGEIVTVPDAVAHHPLRAWRVSLHEEPGDKFKIMFECWADDAEHAIEQAESAYPGCEIVLATTGWGDDD